MELCAGPGCQNHATTGPLCYSCEARWMKERGDVVAEAEHLTEYAAAFLAWCEENGQPDPFHED